MTKPTGRPKGRPRKGTIVKKKNLGGRPRKHPIITAKEAGEGEAAVPGANGHHTPGVAGGGSAVAAAASPAPSAASKHDSKRGPGRPRKHKSSDHDQDHAQVFSTQFISAMHVDDAVPLDRHLVITDQWRERYNDPIQVPSSKLSSLTAVLKPYTAPCPLQAFARPRGYITWTGRHEPHYEADAIDRSWLRLWTEEMQGCHSSDVERVVDEGGGQGSRGIGAAGENGHAHGEEVERAPSTLEAESARGAAPALLGKAAATAPSGTTTSTTTTAPAPSATTTAAAAKSVGGKTGKSSGSHVDLSASHDPLALAENGGGASTVVCKASAGGDVQRQLFARDAMDIGAAAAADAASSVGDPTTAALTEDSLALLIMAFERATAEAAAALDPTRAAQFDDTVCDICREPDSEAGNEMVFCDRCNVGVHQLCYGVPEIPEGSWYCTPCKTHTPAQCCMCAESGGALQPTTDGHWVHVSCTLWIPEAFFVNQTLCQPVNLSSVPAARLQMRCSICRVRQGACIQCHVPECTKAFHVPCAQATHLLRLRLAGSRLVREAFCMRHLPADSGEDAAPAQPTSLYIAQKEFCEYVDVQKVALETALPLACVTAAFEYWVLRRRANGGLPLIRDNAPPAPAKPRNKGGPRARFKQLRLSLELARSLSVQIQRRERLKRELTAVRQAEFRLSLKTHLDALGLSV